MTHIVDPQTGLPLLTTAPVPSSPPPPLDLNSLPQGLKLAIFVLIAREFADSLTTQAPTTDEPQRTQVLATSLRVAAQIIETNATGRPVDEEHAAGLLADQDNAVRSHAFNLALRSIQAEEANTVDTADIGDVEEATDD